MIKSLNSCGETIVEVLISLAVLALVLAGAFAVVNQSTRGVRQAQEHSEALKIAENQLEYLRVAATDSGTTTIFNQTNYFCMTQGDNDGINDAINPSGTIVGTSFSFPALNSTTDKGLIYRAPCTQDNGSYIYSFAIDRYTVVANSQYVFDVHVRWDSVSGTQASPHAEVSLSYKINQQ